MTPHVNTFIKMSLRFKEIIPAKYQNRGTLENFDPDTLDTCADKNYFINYAHQNITYKFNTHGYRDDEWPTDLKDVIWCIGASDTFGVGLPVEKTWPSVLQVMTGRRCLNLGEPGCSNDTMRLRAEFVHTEYGAKNIIMMWTFLSRRRIDGEDVGYSVKDFGDKEDIQNFTNNYTAVNTLPANVFNFACPGAGMWQEATLKQKFPKLFFVHRIDFARDSTHMGVKTSMHACAVLMKKFNLDKTK